MQAAVCHAFGEPLVVEEVELDAPRQGEVRVRVAACAVCHSDVAYASGAWGGSVPAVYGHEAAGIVEETGDGAGGLRASGTTATFDPGELISSRSPLSALRAVIAF